MRKKRPKQLEEEKHLGMTKEMQTKCRQQNDARHDGRLNKTGQPRPCTKTTRGR